MAQGLSPARIVDVDVSFAPLAVPLANFDTLLLMGTTDVIDVAEGVRIYNSIQEVAGDFASTAPEYLAASLYFAQSPQPDTLYIGRWAETTTSGRLVCGVQTLNQQLMSNWTWIKNGHFKVSVDGPVNVVTGVDLSTCKNMVQVANKINVALPGAQVAWNGTQFIFTSQSAGPLSSVGYLQNCDPLEMIGTAPTNMAAQLKGYNANNNTPSSQPWLAERSVNGWLAETPVKAVARVDGLGWYAVQFVAPLNNGQLLSVSAYCQAGIHMHGLVTRDVRVFDTKDLTDIASQMRLAGYTRTVVQYSANRHAIASFFGRAFTTNFEGSNTTITMMFKQMPGVPPETLTAAQAAALTTKRVNVYAMYINGVPILQEGMVSGRAYFDEVHGTDWLANRIQTDLYNVLLQTPKIPQTNAGIHILMTAMEAGLSQAVTNGLVAPGVWNAPGFGALQQGDYLETGFYSYVASVDTQPPAIRESRRAPLLQAAVKMAGAVHFAEVLINVNR